MIRNIKIMDDVNDTLDVFIFFSLLEFQWFDLTLESLRAKLSKDLAVEILSNFEPFDNPLNERILVAGAMCKIHLSIFSHSTIDEVLRMRDKEVDVIVKNLYKNRILTLIEDRDHITLQEFLGVDNTNPRLSSNSRQNISNLLATI